MEILLVMAIVVIILGFSFPLYKSFSSLNTHQAVKNEVVQLSRLAHARSLAGLGDQEHGLYFSGLTVTLYEGSDYVSRIQSNDRVHELPEKYFFDNTYDIVFAVKTGLVGGNYQVGMGNSIDNTVLYININTEGYIY